MAKGDLWGFLRNVLTQGMAIQMDVQAGKYPDSELMHCRLDEAARERAEQLQQLLVESNAGQ